MTAAAPAAPESPSAAPVRSARGLRGRPFGLYVVVVFRIADALALAALAFSLRPLPSGGVVERLVSIADPDIVRAVVIGWATISIIGALGLLAGQRWGWVLTMVLVGAGILGDFVQRASGNGDDLHLLLLVVAAFYLNQRAVRVQFERHRP
jgi:hypothetical protein